MTLHDIPTPPSGLALILRAAQAPDADLVELAQLVAREPGLTVHVLRVANSAAYRRPSGGEVTSVAQATVMLGLRTLRNVAVAHAVTSLFRREVLDGFDMNLFWEDSLRRGCAAKILAQHSKLANPDEAFTVGLIQEVGVLMLARAGMGRSVQALRTQTSAERLREENRLASLTHVDAFLQMASSWGLPQDLVTAVSLHHEEDVDHRCSGSARGLAKVAMFADLLADVAQTMGGVDSLTRIAPVLARNVPHVRLSDLIDELSAEMERQSRDLEIRIHAQPRFETLMVSASDALQQLSQSYEALTRRLEDLIAEKDSLSAELAAKNKELARLVRTDPLTGLLNRRAFSTSTSGETDGRPNQGLGSMLIVDIDHFKVVNDRYGHQTGDDVLVEVARILQEANRGRGDIVRLGGEEFALYLPGIDNTEATSIAERIRRALERTEMRARSGHAFRVTTSIGGTTLRGAVSWEELFQLADAALYRAKQEGRNRTVWDTRLS